MRKAKRILAVGLTFIFMFTMLPQNTLAAVAGKTAETTEMVDADLEDISTSNAFDALGIDTSVIPEGVDPNSTDNPYGRNTYTPNTVYEVLLQNANTKSGGNTSDLFGNNKALGNKLSNVLIEENHDAVDVGKLDNGMAKTVAGHFNNSKDSKKAQFATVYLDGADSDSGLYLYFSKLNSSSYTGFCLVDPGTGLGLKGYKQYDSTYKNLKGMLHNYLQIATGDYDGDGVDEIAVFVPAADDEKILVYDLQIDDTYASDDEYFLNTSKWELAWTYKLGFGLNMVSLSTGDFNRDGIDDLTLTYGSYLSSTWLDPSNTVVYFGDRMNVFQNWEKIEMPDEITRASAVAGDLNGDGVPELVIGGNLLSDMKNTNIEYGNGTYNLNSRYVAVYNFDNSENKFNLLFAQNFNLFEKDDNNDYLYSCMARDKEIFYSLPILKANLAVAYFGGMGDYPYIYLDSLLFQFTDSGLKLVYTFDGKKSNYGYGFYYDFYKDNSGKSILMKDPRFYMEYDIVAGDMTGNGYDTSVVMLDYPACSNGISTNYSWLNTLMSNSKPDNSKDVLQEYIMARFVAINTGNYNPDSIGEGSFTASNYNYFYNEEKTLRSTATAVLCNTDNDTTYLSYTGEHTVIYSDPKVLAVLASTPYFKDLDRDDLSGSMLESETTYSSTTGSGSGSSEAVSISVGTYLSGKVGAKGAYAETEINATYGFTYEYAKNSTMEMTVTYSTLVGQDTVVFYSIPMEVYYYNAYYPILDDNGNVKGYDKQIITVNIPHTAAVKTISLEKYEKIAQDYPALPSISGNVLKSTPGDPSSYPQSTAGYENAIVYSGDWSGIDYSDRGGSTTQEIAITEEYEETYTNSVNVEFKLGGGYEYEGITWKAEGSGGIITSAGGDFAKITTSSVGSSYSGTIFDLPAEAETYGYYFAWKLFTYTYEIDGVNVPVVSYLVKDVRRPPELPDDFEQDYSKTTSDTIGLTWSYSAGKNVTGFQIYRYYDFPEGGGSYKLEFIPVSDYASITYDDDGKAVYHFEYLDTGRAPYTEYYYQIQATRSATPPDSILSEKLKTRTKPTKGEPTITLNGVQTNTIPKYDSAGNLIGTKETYTLLVYPDTASTVSVTVSGVNSDPRDFHYQWQRNGENGWEDIKGATSAQYKFAKSGYAQIGEYRCRVNSMYYDEETAQTYYITTYSKVFTLEYSMRQAMVKSFATDLKNKTVSITLKSVHKNHYYAPTGLVTFHIEGQDYDQYFHATLRANMADYTSTATLDLASTGENDYGANLLTGAYRITAFYSGSRVFQALDVDEKVYYVADNAEGYFLNMDSQFTYGDPIQVELVHVYMGQSGRVVIEPVTSGVTYEFSDGSSVSPDEIVYTDDSSYQMADKYYLRKRSFVRPDGSFAATRTGDYYLDVSFGSETVRQMFHVSKRPITLGFDHTFYGVYKHDVYTVTLNDVVVLDGSYAFDDTIINLRVGVNIREPDWGDWVNDFGIDTLPGQYEVSVGWSSLSRAYDDNYDITFISGVYYIVSSRYDMTMTAEKLDGEIVGTVGIISPKEVTLSGGKTTTATTTATNNTWKGTAVFPGGTDLVFKANPQTGYRVVSWTVKTPNQTTTYTTDSNTFVYKTLANDTTVTVSFGYVQNRLYYASSGSGGTVTPVSSGIKSGSVVQPGATFTFVATPAVGYHFVEWILSGSTKSNFMGQVDPAQGTSRTTITMGDSDTSLVAVFERDSYTLTLSDGLVAIYTTEDDTGNPVTRTVSGSTTVSGDTEITVKPKNGYCAGSGDWIVNGNSVGTGLQSYTFLLKENTTIQASVIRNSYKVSVDTTPEGAENKVKVTADGTVTDLSGAILGGSKLEFTAQPARGYIFDHWEVEDVEAGTNSVLTLDSLDANITVKAVFAEDPVSHEVTITAGQNGSIQIIINYTGEGNESSLSSEVQAGTYRSLTVYSADELTIEALPDENYMLRNWTVNDDTIDTDGSRTISYSNISEELNVYARFIPTSFSALCFTANGDGQINAVYNDSVVTSGTFLGNGKKLVLTAVPGNDAMVDYWTYNGDIVRNDDGTPFIGEVLTVDNFFGGDSADYEVFFTKLVQYSVKIEAANVSYDYVSDPAYTGQTSPGNHQYYARHGSKISLALRPSEGYRFTSITINDTPQNPDADGVFRLNITDLSGNYVIKATTKADLTISITPQDSSVDRGSTKQFSANVSGPGNPSQEVTWSVSGNKSNGTSIDANGLLTVGIDETAETLTITATSVEDTDVSATVTVTITTPAPVVTSVTVTPDTASVDKGSTKQFSAMVSGLFNPSQEVTWSVSGNKSENTSIDANGLLTVGIDETAETLTITATTVEDTDMLATVMVTITTPAPVVTSVTVTPETASVDKGSTKQFSANVSGPGNPSQEVTWSVSGNKSDGTNIDANGLLTVGIDETAETLTITATSVEDKSRFGHANVSVVSVPKVLKNIKINTVPVKDTYFEGESFDPTGGSLKLEYSDGTYEIIDIKISMVSGFDSSKTGVQNLSVTYNGMMANFDVRVIPLEIRNEMNTVTLDLSETVLPSRVIDVTLYCEVISDKETESDHYTAVHDLLSNMDNGDLHGFILYDLELLDQDGNAVEDFTGKIKVKVKIPDNLKGSDNLYVFWYDPDNNVLVDMNATVEGDYLVFETTHFSSYTVAALSNKTTSELVNNPDTRDCYADSIYYGFGIAALLLIFQVVLKKRKGVNFKHGVK